MIITLFFLFLMLLMFVIFQTKNHLINNVIFSVILITLALFAGLRGPDHDRDYSIYLYYWQINEADVEESFILIRDLLKNTFSLPFISLIIFYAILGVTTKIIGIKKITSFFYLSTLLYFSHYYLLHELTQIRVGAAAGFFLISLIYLYDSNAKYFFIWVGIACFFHYSAFIALPLWFLRKDSGSMTIYAFLIPAGYIFHFAGGDFFSNIPIPYIQDKIEIYQKLQDLGIGDADKINVFNYMFLSKIVLFYIILFNAKKIYVYNKYVYLLLKIYAISLAVFPAFAVIPASAFRIQEFLGVVEIILIPLLVYLFRVRVFGYISVISISLGFLLLNIYYNKLIR